ncbi:MAG: ATPase, partial [Opitutae bacterium]|nr:ATPase [Opitutae bacterium]
MDFTAGWDGGGTKTRVVCLSLAGESLASGAFGPLNLNGASALDVRRTVSDALSFQHQVGNCVSLVVSAAGISHPETVALLRQLIRDGGYAGPLTLVGDQESALYGAVGNRGAVLIAGTGSICFGRNESGETARSGGYGHLVDDEGSGYAIGRDIVSAVLRAEDGRMQPTLLRELLFRDAAWRDIPSILRHLYQGEADKSKIAALAPLALEARDDPAAQAILERAARELT